MNQGGSARKGKRPAIFEAVKKESSTMLNQESQVRMVHPAKMDGKQKVCGIQWDNIRLK